ncbi:hypothetical protein ACTJKN_20050 [Pedobacter sp. 22163]
MKKRFALSVVLTLYTVFSYSQGIADVKVELTPFIYDKIFEINQYKPVKLVTYLENVYYNDAIVKRDTLYQEHLTADNKRLSYTSFNKNKTKLTALYKYFPEKHFQEWRDQDLNEINYNRLIKNRLGKNLTLYQARVFKGDTTSRTYTKFSYNSDGLLVKKSFEGSYGANKLGTSATTYDYVNKNMVLTKSYYDTSKSSFYQAIAYKYNAENLPVEKKAYQVRNNMPDTPALYTYYTYDRGLLVNEKYEDFNDKAKKIATTVDYYYNSNKQLIKLHTKSDTLFKTVVYEYGGEKLKKVTIQTNTLIGLNREERVYVYDKSKLPLTFVRLFEYDEFGNVIRLKYFLNGQRQHEFVKELVYY